VAETSELRGGETPVLVFVEVLEGLGGGREGGREGEGERERRTNETAERNDPTDREGKEK